MLTLLVAIGKVAVVWPAATSTDLPFPGTAALLLPASVTVTPPLGAGPLKVTVPCEASPPATVAGVTVTETSVRGGVTVSVALLVTPP